MPKQDLKQEPKEEALSVGVGRPVGLSFASFFYGASGLYYLIYPLVQDTSLYQLYTIGAISILGAIGIMRLARWGLWIGLGLFPLQIVAPAFALMSVLQYPGATSGIVVGYIVSLAILIFFASLTFLLVLDKRRSFR